MKAAKEGCCDSIKAHARNGCLLNHPGLNSTEIENSCAKSCKTTQAIARAHRIGQDKQVIAYRFITQNSIEEKILQLQEDKRRLAETFITDSEALPALSNEQWADLLK